MALRTDGYAVSSGEYVLWRPRAAPLTGRPNARRGTA